MGCGTHQQSSCVISSGYKVEKQTNACEPTEFPNHLFCYYFKRTGVGGVYPRRILWNPILFFRSIRLRNIFIGYLYTNRKYREEEEAKVTLEEFYETFFFTELCNKCEIKYLLDFTSRSLSIYYSFRNKCLCLTFQEYYYQFKHWIQPQSIPYPDMPITHQ